MFFGILILCTNIQISANELSNSSRELENKKQKINESFLSKRLHNAKKID